MSLIDGLLPGPVHALVGVVLLAWLLLRPRQARSWRLHTGLRVAALAWLAWIWIASTPGIGNLLVAALERRHTPVDLSAVLPDPDSEVIVLASGQMFRPDGTPAPALDADGRERLQTGIALWRRTGGRLVLAGGPGFGPADSFAGVMRRAALEDGVPEAAIRLARGSRNTYEDLKAVAALSDATTPDQPVRRYLVTSALHLPRAMAVARGIGLVVQPVPCATRHLARPTWRAWLPDNGDPVLWRGGLHEWIGLAVYRWRGWAAPDPGPVPG